MRPCRDEESCLWMAVEMWFRSWAESWAERGMLHVEPLSYCHFRRGFITRAFVLNVPRGTFAEASQRSSFRAQRRPLFHVEHFSAKGDFRPLKGNICRLSGHLLLAKEKNSTGIGRLGLEC